MRDLRIYTRQESVLNAVTEGDLAIELRDLTFVNEGPRVRQQMRIRLCSFRGEWFLAPSYGLPYFEEIFVKGPLLDSIAGLFFETLRTVPSVDTVTELTLDLVEATRGLNVRYEATSSFGVISETVTGPL